MRPVTKNSPPDLTHRSVQEAVQATGDAGILLSELCITFQRGPHNTPFKRRLRNLLDTLTRRGDIKFSKQKRRWIAAHAIEPNPDRMALPPRYDMRTAGTYTQGADWMRASRPGAQDAGQIRSRTFFSEGKAT